MANRQPPAHIIEKFDKDGDGKLSDEERAEIRKEMMAKFDKDGDGKLSPEERKAAMEARSKLSQGKGKVQVRGKGKAKVRVKVKERKNPNPSVFFTAKRTRFSGSLFYFLIPSKTLHPY